jgi:hypothetical protein
VAEQPAFCEEFRPDLSLLPALDTTRQTIEAPIQGSFFDDYLRLPKGLAVGAAAGELGDLAVDLARSDHPKEILAAGWAAVESALMSHGSTESRLRMLYWGVTAWERSHDIQQASLNAGNAEVRVNESEPLRTRRAIAAAPIFEGIIHHNLGEGALRKTFDNTLEVAEESLALFQNATDAHQIDARNDFAGLDSELLVQLLDNLPLQTHAVTVPAPLRADDGWYNRNATHDLLSLRLASRGVVKAIPTEVKGAVKARDIARYRAMLIGTKVTGHLYVVGTSVPERINAVRAVYTDTASAEQVKQVRVMQGNVRRVHHRYTTSNRLKRLSPRGSVTQFHDMHKQG